MYLKSVLVSPRGTEIEFSYPKRISRKEIEFMGMKIKKNIDVDCYTCDEEGRIYLRNSLFHIKNGRSFVIKPIAERKDNDYIFSIKIFEKINDEMKLLTSVNCELTYSSKKAIHDTFYESTVEIKKKLESLDSLELLFWSGGYEDFDTELFYESSFCYPAEIFTNKGKEYWKVESFVDSDYLERLLDDAINKKYGFSNVFKMLEYSMSNVIKQSKFKFDATKIMEKMHEINNGFHSFSLGSIVVQK